MVANPSTHEPHRKFASSAKPALPSEPLHPESREACDLLESLDDAMFAAIAGDAAALTAARDLWSHAFKALSPELIDESREQYMRFAVDVTRRLECDEIRDPAKAMIAVEVIELLTKG